MEVEFTGDVWHWRGPSPFYFVTVPPDEGAALDSVAAMASYGWGVIPVTARIGETAWKTSLFPKEGSYVVPLKVAIRRSEGIEEGHPVAVTLTVDV